MKKSDKARLILNILEKNNPEPKSELDYSTPWQLLVAAVLSAQSTDRQVNRVTASLFARYPGPAEMATATPDELAWEIHGLGLYRNKSKNLVNAARMIMEKYGGQVPRTFAELCVLPGVGRKTANVILSNAFGIPALAVDTHVFRVARRLGLASAKSPKEVERQLTEIIPRDLWSKAHHWLILHGRYTCTARKPRCPKCPLIDYCDDYRLRTASNGTPKKPRKK
jgi:endonuclease-3